MRKSWGNIVDGLRIVRAQLYTFYTPAQKHSRLLWITQPIYTLFTLTFSDRLSTALVVLFNLFSVRFSTLSTPPTNTATGFLNKTFNSSRRFA